MSSVKVSVIAPDSAALARVTADLHLDRDADLSTRVGAVEQVCGAVLQERPDLLVAKLPTASERDLVAIESALSAQPNTSLILLSPQPSPEFLLRAMQAGVREVVPLPLKNGEFREAFTRHYERLQHRQARPGSAGRVMAFMPVKGGCGATFLATGLAHALSLRENQRVAVIDLNLTLGDAAIFLSEAPVRSTLAEVCAQEHRLDAALLEAAMTKVSERLWLLAAPDPERAVGVRPESVERILTLARTRFDFVIVDTGRSLDGVTLRALDSADSVLLVAQALLPCVHNGKRLLQVLRELGYGSQKLQLVVNRVEKGSDLSPAELRRALQFDQAREIPNSYANVATAINHGLPLLAHAPKDPVARALAAWAQALVPAAAPAARPRIGWMRGLGLSRP